MSGWAHSSISVVVNRDAWHESPSYPVVSNDYPVVSSIPSDSKKSLGLHSAERFFVRALSAIKDKRGWSAHALLFWLKLRRRYKRVVRKRQKPQNLKVGVYAKPTKKKLVA